MGRLDELDLSLTLSRKEQEERLAAAQRRLSALRLQLGGLIGSGELGPGLLTLFDTGGEFIATIKPGQEDESR